jgi:glyoxylase-like metal-dependent hydrolase (beta-lactamase superfamily II)
MALRNIRQHILTLPDDTILLPGHGPATTVGQERENNPFLA